MTARFFVDTNVLVYAVSSAAADQSRRELALELLGRPDALNSAPVFHSGQMRVLARCWPSFTSSPLRRRS